MKKIIIVAMALGVMTISAQGIKRTTVEKETVNNAKFEVIQKIEDNDTMYFVSVVYQNMKYSTLIDTEIILFNKKDDYYDFVDAIKEIAEQDSNSEYEYATSNGSRIYSSKYGVVIYSKQGKYTMVNRKAYLKKHEKLRSLGEYLM
jgi:hypothetical protein